MAFILTSCTRISRKILSTRTFGLSKPVTTDINNQLYKKIHCSIKYSGLKKLQYLPILSVQCNNGVSVHQGLHRINGTHVHNMTRTYSTLVLQRTLSTSKHSPFISVIPMGRYSTSVLQRTLSTAKHSPFISVIPLGRYYSSNSNDSSSGGGMSHRNKSVMMYMFAVFILAIGVTYAAVPLYSVFCQATGYGGAVKEADTAAVETMKPFKKRPLLIQFNADTAASMRWNFKPQQREVMVYPGETALAFYSAVNPTDKPIVGISTYNVLPFEAGKYFNKIQCFCFEEQRLNPYEQVDMPVFFFIDPEFAADRKMDKYDTIVLSYTFFEAKDGLQLPDPFERR